MRVYDILGSYRTSRNRRTHRRAQSIGRKTCKGYTKRLSGVEKLEDRTLLSITAGLGAADALEQPQYVPGEILVGFEGDVAATFAKHGATAALQAAGRQFEGLSLNALDVLFELPKTVNHAARLATRWQLPGNVDVLALAEQLVALPGIAYAEPNYVVSTMALPNDPKFDQLWGLDNLGQTGGVAGADIDAPEAWDISTGSGNMVVGVIDTGVNYNHVDLAANIWTNPGEIAGNGIDDDGNNFIDDVHGWDFANDDNDPMDDNKHGTHVAGTIGAVGNNGVGVTGVNWNVQIMALKFLDNRGSGTTADAVEAINYATMMRQQYGVNITVTNNSWGGGGFSQALSDAILASGEANMLFVASAGNSGGGASGPANYGLDNIISVAATDHSDALASFSSRGSGVDLAAPGVDIVSTMRKNYGTLSGTSMASPHVAGVAALAWDRLTGTAFDDYQVVRDIIFAGVDPLPSLSGLTGTGGRLNAHSTLVLSEALLGNATTIAIDDVSQLEGNAGTSDFVFTVSRVGPTPAMTIDWATSDGTATAADGDYVAAFGQLDFTDGQTDQTITITVNGDTVEEINEKFVVNLSNLQGNVTPALIVDAQGVGKILDDDRTLSISFPDFSDPTGLNLVGEATITGTNVLRLTPQETSKSGGAWYSTPQYAWLGFETIFEFQVTSQGSDGFAFVMQNDGDTVLSGGGGNLGYNNLLNSLAVEFDTYSNSQYNDPNNNHVSIHTAGTGPNGPSESLSLGSITPTFDINDGNPHTVKLLYDAGGTLSLYLDDLVTPALQVDVDLSQLLNWDSGSAFVGFTGVSGGAAQSHDILSWTYMVLADTTTTIAIDDLAQMEGNVGTTDLVFTVRRMGDTSGSATMDWETSDGTATAASGDYVAASGQVTFAADETEQTITITGNGDTAEESHETFFVNLSAVVGATSVDGRGTATILNDDATISVADTTVTEGDENIQFIDDFITAGSGGIDGPNAMAIGPDGNFYIAGQSSNNVLRYDPTTGELIDEFVSLGSGGLDNPRGLIFGADENLYAISANTDSVLRYQGPSGANPGQFIDTFVSTGSGGLDSPYRGAFGPDGNLYVSNTAADSVLRYQGPFGSDPGQFIDTFVAVASGGLDAPTALVFDVDGNLYVSSAGTDNVLRYQGPSDSTPGQFIDTFVATASGGLDSPHALIFGADGNLYVSSAVTDSVLRYQGPSDSTPGQFIDTFVPTGSGGLDSPRELTFGADGNLYAVSKSTSEVLRYGVSSQAVFTVSLSSEIGGPVSVDFATDDGTAKVVDGDYTATGGTVTFAPGVTSRTIIVSTLDDALIESDETFVVNLTNPSTGTTISDNQGEATIFDDDTIAPPDANDIYVWNIQFDSRTRGKGGSKHDERVLVTIRRDSDSNGVADASDAVVAGANVIVEVRDSSSSLIGTLSGITDTAGVFTSSYLTDLPDDTYTADVTVVTEGTSTWNTTLDVEADETHTVPHAAGSSLLALAFENLMGDTSSGGDDSDDISSLLAEETAEVAFAPPADNRWHHARTIDSAMTLLGLESDLSIGTSFEFDGIGDDILEDLVVGQI